MKQQLTAVEVDSFKNAPRLVSNHIAEKEINFTFLKELKQPVCTMIAVNKPLQAAKCDAKDAGGLENSLSLAIGAKVMLRSNLHVDAGLTNGTIGTVHNILYSPDLPGPNALPTAVCVDFPDYQGQPWNPLYPKVVPIAAITSIWNENLRQFSRTQIPLSLAFATTIHKSQGWTKSKIVVDIGMKEIGTGLSFVAFSRVKSIDGIMIDPLSPDHIQWPRFLKINQHKGQKDRAAMDDYIDKLSAAT